MLRIEELDHPPKEFLPDQAEGYDFYKALQASKIDGFRFGYFAVYRQNQLITVAPYFVMDFRLATLLPDSWLKKCLSWIKFNLACIGNPTADFGRIEGEVSAEVLACIDQRLAKKGSLLAYKGFPDGLPLAGFVQAAGLPVPVVPLRADYFDAMQSKRRNLLKRKLKKAATLRYEEHDSLPPELVEKVYALYLNTYQKAELKFEKLTPEYFSGTSKISKYLLFFYDDELIGFTQLIGKNGYLVNRYIGLDYDKSTSHNLYFVMFIRAVEMAVREGYTALEMGATSYEFKRILGARQVPTWNYYRHTKPWANWILGKLRTVLEPSASELK